MRGDDHNNRSNMCPGTYRLDLLTQENKKENNIDNDAGNHALQRTIPGDLQHPQHLDRQGVAALVTS